MTDQPFRIIPFTMIRPPVLHNMDIITFFSFEERKKRLVKDHKSYLILAPTPWQPHPRGITNVKMIPPHREETEPTHHLSWFVFIPSVVCLALSLLFPVLNSRVKCGNQVVQYQDIFRLADPPRGQDQLSNSIILFIRLRKQDKRKIEVFTFVFS